MRQARRAVIYLSQCSAVEKLKVDAVLCVSYIILLLIYKIRSSISSTRLCWYAYVVSISWAGLDIFWLCMSSPRFTVQVRCWYQTLIFLVCHPSKLKYINNSLFLSYLWFPSFLGCSTTQSFVFSTCTFIVYIQTFKKIKHSSQKKDFFLSRFLLRENKSIMSILIPDVKHNQNTCLGFDLTSKDFNKDV